MRVLLVDEQRLFREGIRALLQAVSAAEVVGQAGSAREAYEMAARLRPDLVITELLLSGVDGVAAVQKIRRLRPGCRVLVLTGCRDRCVLRAAWLSGIDACMTKDESADVLSSAIASLGAGRRYLGPGLRTAGSPLRIVDAEPGQTADPLARLSVRERVIFDLVVRGLTTKAVARELYISTKTVETHRAHINEKLAAHCTADLVRFAFRGSVPVALADGSTSTRERMSGTETAESDGFFRDESGPVLRGRKARKPAR